MNSTLDNFGMYIPKEDGPNNDMWKFVRAMVFLLCTAIVLALCGCKTTEKVVTVVTTDTCYMERTQRDSVYLHDSIYLHEYSKGETIYIERDRWHTAWRERVVRDTSYIAKHDTIVRQDIREVKKPLTGWQRLRLTLGDLMMGAILAALVYGCIKIYRKMKRP